MPKHNYVVQYYGLGAIQHVPVLDVDRLALVDACNRHDTIDICTTLTGGDTWCVQHKGHHLGVVDDVDRQEYAELDWLLEAGITPQITARIERRSGTVNLRLPRAGLCLPVNNPPAAPWVMLSPGPGITLSKLPRNLDLNPGDRLQLLLTLRLGTDAVSVYMGQQMIGILDAEDSARLRPVIEHCNDNGVMAVTYGYHAPKAGRSSITIYPGTVHVHDVPVMTTPVQVAPAPALAPEEEELDGARRGVVLTAIAALCGLLISGGIGLAINLAVEEEPVIEFASDDEQTNAPEYRDIAEFKQAELEQSQEPRQ